ncbi:MAG: FG-GAP-like repeat-containing protein [Dokdonella sp.]
MNATPFRISLVAAVIATFASGLADAQSRLSYQGNFGARNPHADPSFQQFGEGLASGDFDGDGIDDVVILESFNSRMRVMRGRSWDFSQTGFFFKFTSTSVETPGHNGVVATGDFDGDGKDEIVLGFFSQSFNGMSEVGKVSIMRRSSSGEWIEQGFIRLGSNGYPGGSPMEHDSLGRAVAVGDFDDDGYSDLAIGANRRTVLGQQNAGSVLVVYGSASGLGPARSQLWNRFNNGVGDPVEAGDYFGSALAVADFTGDGPDDLVITIRAARCPNGQRGGGVVVMRGSAGGITSVQSKGYFAGVDGTPGSCTEDTDFGRSLATGRFNNDARPDLAIGAYGTPEERGSVTVLASSITGPGPNSSRYFRGSDMPVSPVGASTIGYVLQAGRLRGTSTLDSLLLGAPYEDVNGSGDAGSVWVMHPDVGANGLSLNGVERWVQNVRMALEPIEPLQFGDRFGSSLAVGDFNGDGVRDLAVGAVYRGDPEQHSGAVQFLYQSEFILKNGFD